MDYLCLLDECRIDQGLPNPFLLYGAVTIPWSVASELSKRLDRIRREAGYPFDLPLKWSWQGGPVTPEAHAQAKSALLRALRELGVHLFVSLVHRRIAAGVAEADQATWFAANGVLRAVDRFLSDSDGRGLVVLDRFTSAHDFAEEKATLGLVYPNLSARVALPRFFSFSVGSSKSSLISSAVDVALGAFGYCLNVENREAVPEVSSLVMPLVARDAGGNAGLYGVTFYPMPPRVPDHVEAYRRVASTLKEYGLRGLPEFDSPTA
jgi:hypothetical protein